MTHKMTPQMTRLKFFALLLILSALAPAANAEYAVLRSGQRLHITGYENRGATVLLRLKGGKIEVPASELVAIEPEDVFTAPPPAATATLPVPFADLIRAASQKYAVDQELIASVILVESNFNPRAVSPRNARGLMQLLPETAQRFAVVNVFDPAQNIDAGTRYLKELLELYKQDLRLTLAAYNAGPDRVEQFRGVPPFAETVSYVHRVTQTYSAHKTRATPPNPPKKN
jgi:soluble lytic murein transglycosylase-like protein